jgi:transposase
MPYMIAGIDVHKKLLVVVVADAEQQELTFECRRFGATTKELKHLAAWLCQRGVEEVVMESTAQYWKPVWLGLEAHFQLHLAQAYSNRAPKGRKTDFRDSQRLVRRFVAGELILSFVPDAEQREVRTVTRRKVQLSRDKVRLQSQLECLLEEGQIKLSSVLSDLLGASGRRILEALAAGVTDLEQLAALGDDRLKCTREQLQEALDGSLTAIHRQLLRMYLEDLALIERHSQALSVLAAEILRPYQDAVLRLAEVPGIRVNAAQQIIAEVGPQAKTFPTARQLCSWAGTAPGRNESAGEDHGSGCPKGNRFLRRLLCQLAQAAVKTNNSHFQALFCRLEKNIGYRKAIWAVARHMTVVIWKILHQGVRYEERGQPTAARSAQRRIQRMVRELRELGYTVDINTPELAVCTG